MTGAAVLNGSKAIVANTCHDCGGALIEGGRFHERMVDVNNHSAYAAAICRPCAVTFRAWWKAHPHMEAADYEPGGAAL